MPNATRGDWKSALIFLWKPSDKKQNYFDFTDVDEELQAFLRLRSQQSQA
jgi:hypothetical protein